MRCNRACSSPRAHNSAQLDQHEYLLERGISERVAENFQENEVSGSAFLKLSEEDIRELVPPIGIRAAIRDMLEELKKVSTNTVLIR